MDKATKTQLEEVLKNSTPSNLDAQIPAHAKSQIATFAQCFVIKKEDILRLIGNETAD